MRLGSDGRDSNEGPILLHNAYFNPREIIDHSIDSILPVLAEQRAENA
jgi:hypothetical protein